MTNVKVIKAAHVGPSTFLKMKKNEHVTLEVQDKIYEAINYHIWYIYGIVKRITNVEN